MRVGIDIDQTLADLHTPWIRWLKWRGKAGPELREFTHWNHPLDLDVDAFTYLHPRVYDRDEVQPLPNALRGVRMFRDYGVPIAFVTSVFNRTGAAKRRWLERHGFWEKGDGFVMAHDKSGAPVDVLVDDYIGNLRTFPGRAIMIDAAHNRHDAWPFRALDVYHAASMILAP